MRKIRKRQKIIVRMHPSDRDYARTYKKRVEQSSTSDILEEMTAKSKMTNKKSEDYIFFKIARDEIVNRKNQLNWENKAQYIVAMDNAGLIDFSSPRQTFIFDDVSGKPPLPVPKGATAADMIYLGKIRRIYATFSKVVNTL